MGARNAKGRLSLFAEDTRFLVFMDATATEPTQELHGREPLAPVSSPSRTASGCSPSAG
ncbi:hypothetical protein [Streptomyces sp. NPDC091217]|uniref:hypothetical protein n=1 Tax=Streptomyces sp. NPDC091217 TaxID=3365975 RepID=UPI0037FC8D2D